MLPISSTLTAQPSFSHQAVKSSRPCLSRSVRVRRLQPPLGVPPIFAISMSASQSLGPLTRTFDKSDIPRTPLKSPQRYYEFDQMVKYRNLVHRAEKCGAAGGGV